MDETLSEIIAELNRYKAEVNTLKLKIEQWKKHNRECMIARYSALGCRCGLVKK